MSRYIVVVSEDLTEKQESDIALLTQNHIYEHSVHLECNEDSKIVLMFSISNYREGEVQIREYLFDNTEVQTKEYPEMYDRLVKIIGSYAGVDKVIVKTKSDRASRLCRLSGFKELEDNNTFLLENPADKFTPLSSRAYIMKKRYLRKKGEVHE